MHSFWTILLFFSIFNQLNSATKHPIYTSITEVDYKAEISTIEISVKLFANDLEKLLSKQTGETVEIGTSREHPNATQLIKDYLETDLKFKVDNESMSFKYLGRENGDLFTILIFLTIENVKTLNKLEVENNLLIPFLPTQFNFVACHTSKGLQKKIATKGNIFLQFDW